MLSLAGTVLITTLATAPAVAKFEDYLTQRWFAVEVIVFERSNINDKNTLEALAHPHPTPEPEPFLVNPDETFIQLTEPLEPTDSNGLLADEVTRLTPREPTQQRRRLETPFANPATDPTTDSTINKGPSVEALRLDFLQALTEYELALESRNLAFEADANPVLAEELARLSRPRNNTIVWRGRWLQAVPNRKEPQPLVVAVNELESGEFQLTGSLEVTVNRYLHLRAKLWYHDPAFGAELMTAELAGYSAPSDRAALPQQPVQSGTYSSQSGQQSSGQGLAPSTAEQYAMEQNLPEPLFMLLDQTRRMRSGILHYLDHPKLGLLVRIDKVPPPAELLAQYKAFEASQK